MGNAPHALGASPTGRALPASAWLHLARSADIDEHAASQPHWSLHYEQLSAGPFEGWVQHVQLPGLRLVHEEASRSVRQRGHIGRDQFGFAMPLRLTDHAVFNGQQVNNDSIMIGRSEELDLYSPPSFGLVGIVVDAALLRSLWQRMYQKDLTDWLGWQVVVRAGAVMAADLRMLHLGALANIAAVPSLLNDATAVMHLRDALLIAWIEAIPNSVAKSELATGEARKLVVDRACEFMVSRPDEPPTLLQVCDRVGASPRKLEYCFRAMLGMSATQYLRAARLNGVRRELGCARGQGASVQDIAARWGYWHLGEFGAAYKRQFGELPSVTLYGPSARGTR